MDFLKGNAGNVTLILPWYILIINDLKVKLNSMKQNQSFIESFSSLLTSIIIPTLILMYGKDYFPLSPIQLLLFALAFPASFSVFELYKTKNISFISILGILNVLLTGGIACLSSASK